MPCYCLHALHQQKAVTQAELISVDGGRVKKFDVKAETDANALGKRISEATLQVWQFCEPKQWAPSINICKQALCLQARLCLARSMFFQVTGLKSHNYNRGPSAPYMTSTMLMDAANQLGSDVAATMTAAQGLFEGDVEGMLGNQGQHASWWFLPLCC